MRRQRCECTEKWVSPARRVIPCVHERTQGVQCVEVWLAWCKNILLYSLGWSTPCPRAALRQGIDFATPTSTGSSPAVQSGMVRRSGVATGALRRNRGWFTVPSRLVNNPEESSTGVACDVGRHRLLFPRCAVYAARARGSLGDAAVLLPPPLTGGPLLPLHLPFPFGGPCTGWGTGKSRGCPAPPFPIRRTVRGEVKPPSGLSACAPLTDFMRKRQRHLAFCASSRTV